MRSPKEILAEIDSASRAVFAARQAHAACEKEADEACLLLMPSYRAYGVARNERREAGLVEHEARLARERVHATDAPNAAVNAVDAARVALASAVARERQAFEAYANEAWALNADPHGPKAVLLAALIKHGKQ